MSLWLVLCMEGDATIKKILIDNESYNKNFGHDIVYGSMNEAKRFYGQLMKDMNVPQNDHNDHYIFTDKNMAEKYINEYIRYISNIRLTPKQERCMIVLGDVPDTDFGYLSFRAIMFETGLSRSDVRRSVRALARKGMAKFSNGLFTEDGEMAGSGYCATEIGYKWIKKWSTKRMKEIEQTRLEEIQPEA